MVWFLGLVFVEPFEPPALARRERGMTVLRKHLKRSQVAEFMAQLQPCLVSMEACVVTRTTGFDRCLVWAYDQADLAAVCGALCEEQQE